MAYEIRVVDVPKLSWHTKSENKAISEAPLSRVDYRQYHKLFHKNILNNIAEESDFYTYIHPHMKKE